MRVMIGYRGTGCRPAKDTGDDGVHGKRRGIPPERPAEFEAAAQRPLEMCFRCAFIKTYER